MTLAYETYGELARDGGNAILACHALSGDAHAAGWSTEQDAPSAVDGMGADDKGIVARGGLGWWDGMIGPGKAFDTRNYFVICSNVIGGCRGSTGPASVDPATGQPYGSRFPLVTVGDMVRAQRELLRQLGVERLLAVAGGSLGGNQALEWTIAYPEMVAGCVAIATCASLSAQGIAWNEIGRQAITADPAWNGGDYYGGPQPERGLAVARMIGHVTYLSEQSMTAKFGRQRRTLAASRLTRARTLSPRGRRTPATATHGDASSRAVRGGELPATPGAAIRGPVRRERIPGDQPRD